MKMWSNQIAESKEFYIDEFNLDRITQKPIKKYTICTTSLKNIRMQIEGKYYTLDKTPAYLYLEDPVKWRQSYIEYCEKYGSRNPNRNIEKYDELIQTFSIYSYDLQKGAIVIDQHYILKEGQHRCCILLKQLGRDYRIKVVKLYYKRSLKSSLLSFIRRYVNV